jgi:hypothetical protein
MPCGYVAILLPFGNPASTMYGISKGLGICHGWVNQGNLGETLGQRKWLMITYLDHTLAMAYGAERC